MTNHATSPDSQSTLARGHLPFRRRFDPIRLANKALDRALGIHPLEILNTGNPIPAIEKLGLRLKYASRELLAAGFDDETGLLDYSKMTHSKAYDQLRRLTLELPLFDLSSLRNRQARTAFWINLYNVLVLDGLIRYGPIEASRKLPPSLLRRAAYNIGGMRFSPDEIENGILRGNRRNPVLPFPPFDRHDARIRYALDHLDPRVHFALVCGARSCPPIAVYDEDHLEAQLDLAASSFLNSGGSEFEHASQTLRLSKIFQWYQGDFGGREAVLEFVHKNSQDRDLQAAIEAKKIRVRHMPYDWTINSLA